MRQLGRREDKKARVYATEQGPDSRQRQGAIVLRVHAHVGIKDPTRLRDLRKSSGFSDLAEKRSSRRLVYADKPLSLMKG